jgi:hypothetical protein
MRPMSDKDLEVYVDASFCGDWDPKEAATDLDTARSRHGYVICWLPTPMEISVANRSGAIVNQE